MNTSYPAFDMLQQLYGRGNGLPPPDRGDDFNSQMDQIGQSITGVSGRRKKTASAAQTDNDLVQQRNQMYDSKSARESQLNQLMERDRDISIRGADVFSPDYLGGGTNFKGRRVADKGLLSQKANPIYIDGFGNQMPASEQGDRMRLVDQGISGIGNSMGALRYSIGGHIVPRGTIPRFARGGVMPQTGPAIVGEEGPELVQLPAGAQVQPIGTRGNPLTLSNADIQGEIEKERGLPMNERQYGLTPGLGSDNTYPNMADFLRGNGSMSEMIRQFRAQQAEFPQAETDALQAGDKPGFDAAYDAKARYAQLEPLLREMAEAPFRPKPVPLNQDPAYIREKTEQAKSESEKNRRPAVSKFPSQETTALRGEIGLLNNEDKLDQTNLKTLKPEKGWFGGLSSEGEKTQKQIDAIKKRLADHDAQRQKLHAKLQSLSGDVDPMAEPDADADDSQLEEAIQIGLQRRKFKTREEAIRFLKGQ